MRRFLLCIFMVSLLVCGCGSASSKDYTNTNEIINDSEITYNTYNIGKMEYSIPNTWSGDGTLKNDTTVYFYPQNSMFMIMLIDDLGDITNESILKEFAEGSFENGLLNDAKIIDDIADCPTAEITGTININGVDYSSKIYLLKHDDYCYALWAGTTDGDYYDDELNNVLSSITFENKNYIPIISKSTYLDTVRGAFSSSGYNLENIKERNNDEGYAYSFTFENPEQKYAINTINIQTDKTDTLTDIYLFCDNSAWVYIYSYVVLGPLINTDEIEDTLSLLAVDTNNGFYGSSTRYVNKDNYTISTSCVDDTFWLTIEFDE